MMTSSAKISGAGCATNPRRVYLMNPIQIREGRPEDPFPQIGPSLMCADQGNLRQETIDLDRAGVDFFHFDIMDGNFVANLAMSPDMIQALRAATKKPFDVHLMLARPEPYIGRLASSGADSITIHAETGGDLAGAVQCIRQAGVKAGVALNPGTPVSVVEPLLGQLDIVCLMAVEPGFAGQKFIEAILPKIDELAAKIRKADTATRIEMDGNISLERIPDLRRRGASMFVAGTSLLFKPRVSFEDTMRKVRACLDSENTE